jgi:hypothetical protein
LPNDVAITPGVEFALLAVIVFSFTPRDASPDPGRHVEDGLGDQA